MPQLNIDGTKAQASDSRTSSITSKRTFDGGDDASVAGKRQRLANHEPRIGSADPSSSQDDLSDDSGPGSDVSAIQEEDDMSISSGDDDYEIDIIESGSILTSGKPQVRSSGDTALPAQGQESSSTNDLDLPIADILQRLPKVEDYFEFAATHGGKRIKKPGKKLAIRTNLDYVKRLTQAYHRYHEAKNRLDNVLRKGKTDINAQRDGLRQAKAELAWCVYFPITRVWETPPETPPNLTSKKKRTKSPMNLVQEAKKQEFLHTVEACLDTGNLLQLRRGELASPETLDSTPSQALRNQESSQIQRLIKKKTSETRRAHKTEENNRQRVQRIRSQIAILDIDLAYNHFCPLAYPYVLIESFKELGQDADVGDLKQENTAVQIWRRIRTMSPRELAHFKLSGLALDGGEVILTSNNKADMDAVPQDPSNYVQRPPDRDNEPSEQSKSLPDSAALLNLSPEAEVSRGLDESYTDGESSESGEISSGSDEEMVGIAINMQSPPQESGVSEAQIDGAPEGTRPRTNGTRSSKQGRTRKVLADLSPEDLNMQMRYFHAHALPADVPLDLTVRCLCCGEVGHMAGECERLVCTKCDAYNMHLEIDCDMVDTCSRCGRAGHGQATCSAADGICSLCSSRGHQEEDCELLWRTAGAPWRTTIDPTSVKLFCYECGGQGHLGNDCPKRMPGKAFGTSTWSLKNEPPSPHGARKIKNQRPTRQTGELSIKGRADDRMKLPPKPPSSALDMTYSDAGRLPPKPAPKGRIHINPSIAKTSTVNSFQPDWTPVSQSSASDRPPPAMDERSRNSNSGYYQPDRGKSSRRTSDWPAPALQSTHQYPNYEADIQYEYQSPQQNPMRPPAQYDNQPQAYLGSYAVQPPPYQQAPPPRQQAYHPMPSSANKAWSQFRR